MEAVTATQTSIGQIQTMFSPMTGLFPQFLVGSQNLPGNTFLSDNNARGAFNDAGFAPPGLPAAYSGSGAMKAKQAPTKITDWPKTKTAGYATQIVDRYRLGRPHTGRTG